MVTYPTINLIIKLPENTLLTEPNLIENHEKNRNVLRTLVVDELLKERAGKGTGEQTSKFKYVVETLAGGNHIFLTRPVVLNKGFDFVVHVENQLFSNNKDNPKHEDIVNDLKLKISSFNLLGQGPANQFKEIIHNMINKVYYCVEPNLILDNYELEEEFLNVPGYSYEMILKVLKWLFIEQDIRYWNWSGRAMLMNGINDVLKKQYGK